MFEGGDDLRFALKARAELWVKGELTRQDFDGDLPFRERVAGKINNRHAATSQFAFNFVATDSLN